MNSSTLFCLVVLVAVANCQLVIPKTPPTSFRRLGRTHPHVRSQQVMTLLNQGLLAKKVDALSKLPAPEAVACDVCIDFFDSTENTLLNIILNVGLAGTCEKVCGELPKTWEQGICTLLCVGVGFDEFVKFISSADLDPVYECAFFDACPKNHCKEGCTSIKSTTVSPHSAPQRSKFKFDVHIQAHKQTGTGVTIVQWPCPSCQGGANGVETVTTGFTPGSHVVSMELHTDEDEWLYPPRQYLSSVYNCGYDCTDVHGVLFSESKTNFTITAR